MRTLPIALAFGCLSGCLAVDPASLSFANLSAETRRDYREAFFEIPFSEGPISVIATENGRLRTYSLGPCAQSICGGTGRRGTLSRDPDYWIVSGAYRGRTFYLAPGGDGYLVYSDHHFVPLAWD